MERIALKTRYALVFVIAGILAAGQAFADKPSWANSGKSEKSEHRGKAEDNQGGQRDNADRSSRGSAQSAVRVSEHFNDQHRKAAHDYYIEQLHGGRCPPGLAKKNNGCMPPGQAKKWNVGHRLGRDVIFYEVPRPLVVRLGQPPTGYRYVRVATDILLIAIGTGMVIDAIQDLGR